ncbi:MAG: hypothetical protein BWY88_01408 [Synergistetes bacterium ADurb.Bin520]|nr:MAG: hypothetical protein BWY88_01408 [Synergistetes bacterium ADurb.Bin520]
MDSILFPRSSAKVYPVTSSNLGLTYSMLPSRSVTTTPMGLCSVTRKSLRRFPSLSFRCHTSRFSASLDSSRSAIRALKARATTPISSSRSSEISLATPSPSRRGARSWAANSPKGRTTTWRRRIIMAPSETIPVARMATREDRTMPFPAWWKGRENSPRRTPTGTPEMSLIRAYPRSRSSRLWSRAMPSSARRSSSKVSPSPGSI